ncbi:MAG: prephenate dehydratase, partial [Synergistales bacterium]|nr:prephenate dehydratase [Synergistales bacterium]
LAAIQQEIIALCRAVQSPPGVACMGPEGSFSHQAALKAVGHGANLHFVDGPREVFRALENRETELGLVPVENTIEGVVYAALDAFAASPPELQVLREIRLPIRHVLGTHAGDLKEIREVRSHPQALAQCRRWLDSHLPGIPRTPAASTSAAARAAAAESSIAAVCSELAAQANSLPALAQNIQDEAHNTTRFWVVGRRGAAAGPENKTSLLFVVSHTPGSLLYALDPVREEGLNLMLIQSRPLPGNPFEYLFFVDLEGHLEEQPVAQTIESMRSRCFRLRVLGSYPCG